MMTISETLDECIAGHSKWKQRLKTAASSRKAEITVAEAVRDDLCDFGKWLSSGARSLTAAERGTDLERVKQLHKEFHRAASVTLDAALRGDRARYDAEVSIDGGFAKASITLMSAITAWKGHLPRPAAP